MELNNNNLKGDDFEKISSLYPLLYKIKLGSNKIENIDYLKEFDKTMIHKIEVENNPLCLKNKDYSEKLFSMLSKVKTIDGHDSEGASVDTTHYDEEEEEDISFEEGEDDDADIEKENEANDESGVEEDNDEENEDEEDDDDDENSDEPPEKKKKEN